MKSAILGKQSSVKTHTHNKSQPQPVRTTSEVEKALEVSWANLAPFWPLKNLIAVNPLQGFIEQPFEESLDKAVGDLRRSDLPEPMLAVNRETIKWCQVFLDDGQAVVAMPNRELGLWHSWKRLAQYDNRIVKSGSAEYTWLSNLPDDPESAIALCLDRLGVRPNRDADFLTLMLTTLPGWAAYIKYRIAWAGETDDNPNPVSGADYMALRLALSCLMWPDANALLGWQQTQIPEAEWFSRSAMERISQAEKNYQGPLLEKLLAASLKYPNPKHSPDAQLVFCIDVRSEPIRRSIEKQGDYETLGFAGFFGVPVTISDEVTGHSHASCPVLLKPAHEVTESPDCCLNERQSHVDGHRRLDLVKEIYSSVKNSFGTSFSLVELLGPSTGVWMGLKTLAPRLAGSMKSAVEKWIKKPVSVAPDLRNISFDQKCRYAEGALKMMGLTDYFGPLVVLCGHGSATENNAFGSALDCGACGGAHGAGNARILAEILNDFMVRKALTFRGIIIPPDTLFLAALHNTTTDEIEVFADHISEPSKLHQIAALKKDLALARQDNNEYRSPKLGVPSKSIKAEKAMVARSRDWAQVRPEWGLARNASFIAAPRWMTRDMDLGGRAFLHSYDWTQDMDGASLTTILTAPMVVAHWINSQYLFSTLDNVAFGAGSKVTKNIVGKIGIMQGNASDLMHGLPLQSVYMDSETPYHIPARLMTVVYAPMILVNKVVREQEILQNLFGNGWVSLACVDPASKEICRLQRDLSWKTL